MHLDPGVVAERVAARPAARSMGSDAPPYARGRTERRIDLAVDPVPAGRVAVRLVLVGPVNKQH